jgi:hypothetical protein
VLLEHHNVLKELNTTTKPLRDKVYDYVIDLSSEEEGGQMHEMLPDVSNNMVTGVSVGDIE